MSHRPAWTASALLTALSAAKTDVDAHPPGRASEDDVAGRSDRDERVMAALVRREADAELDEICASLGDEAGQECAGSDGVPELEDMCIEELPELPAELVLCLAPDEVLLDSIAF